MTLQIWKKSHDQKFSKKRKGGGHLKIYVNATLKWRSREVFEIEVPDEVVELKDNLAIEEVVLEACDPNLVELIDWDITWNEVLD